MPPGACFGTAPCGSNVDAPWRSDDRESFGGGGDSGIDAVNVLKRQTCSRRHLVCQSVRRASAVKPPPGSVEADLAFHGVEDLRRVVPDAALEHQLDVLHVLYPLGRIAAYDDEVGLLSCGDRADLRVSAKVSGAVERRNPDGLDGRKAGLHEQLECSLVGVSRYYPAETGGVRADDEQSARVGEHFLEPHLVSKEHVPRRVAGFCDRRASLLVLAAGFGEQRVERFRGGGWL